MSRRDQLGKHVPFPLVWHDTSRTFSFPRQQTRDRNLHCSRCGEGASWPSILLRLKPFAPVVGQPPKTGRPHRACERAVVPRHPQLPQLPVPGRPRPARVAGVVGLAARHSPQDGGGCVGLRPAPQRLPGARGGNSRGGWPRAPLTPRKERKADARRFFFSVAHCTGEGGRLIFTGPSSLLQRFIRPFFFVATYRRLRLSFGPSQQALAR